MLLGASPAFVVADDYLGILVIHYLHRFLHLMGRARPRRCQHMLLQNWQPSGTQSAIVASSTAPDSSARIHTYLVCFLKVRVVSTTMLMSDRGVHLDLNDKERDYDSTPLECAGLLRVTLFFVLAGRAGIGSVTHIFSHLRHNMQVVTRSQRLIHIRALSYCLSVLCPENIFDFDF